MPDIVDCAVIGAGPAGLTAGIYLGRFRRSVQVFSGGESRAAWIPRSHNLPGFPEGVQGPVLLEHMRDQAQRYGAVLRSGRVQGLTPAGDRSFTVEFDGGSVQARTVLLATGVLENEPAIPHVTEAIRQGLIRICPICDGFESSGRRIAVVGNSEHAARECLFLRTYTDKLALVLVGEDPSLPEEPRRKLAEAGVEMLETAIDSIRVDETGAGVACMAGGKPYRFDAIYSAFGTTPQSQLAKGLGAPVDKDGRLYAGDHMQTSVEGLYAAGDIVRGLNQISVAAGEAAIAATAIHNRLPRVW
jgi:thioredoxin reductase (NADPH)